MSKISKLGLTAKLNLDILDGVLRAMVQYMPVGDLVMCYTDNWPDKNWMSVFESLEDDYEIYNALIYAVIDCLRTDDDSLLRELFKPILIEKLTETLGAKKITITW